MQEHFERQALMLALPLARLHTDTEQGRRKVAPARQNDGPVPRLLPHRPQGIRQLLPALLFMPAV